MAILNTDLTSTQHDRVQAAFQLIIARQLIAPCTTASTLPLKASGLWNWIQPEVTCLESVHNCVAPDGAYNYCLLVTKVNKASFSSVDAGWGCTHALPI
jgi:hypothetical protein